ncbi:MAG: 2-oxoglutarate dehydrogenase E1 component [Bacteroidales bacterium]|jgi:2-oxoglutarate dehydrogenase E1 component|nr:2-oxoglutarate dehydrogenase E1 component [Bacteroidales bacterium]
MDKFSYLNTNPEEIEALYLQFLENPEKLEYGWRKFFEGFEFFKNDYSAQADGVSSSEYKVINLIEDFRKRGHLFTKTNPVRTRRNYSPSLDYQNYKLEKDDLNKVFEAGKKVGLGAAKLKDIIQMLDQTYCGSVAVEYVYIRNLDEIAWLKAKMETSRNTPSFSRDEKLTILNKLTQAVGFEKFIHKKFPGQKRFSLEGAESLIPALDVAIEHGNEQGIKEFMIGMAHRGRLNVLANIMGKPYHQIFSEFSGNEYEESFLLGDVKYHLGYTSETKTNEGKDVVLTLSPNPSHLEAVNPVVQGLTRAHIDDIKSDTTEDSIIPIIIHGDASIAGQGIVYEVAQMSKLKGYTTGGSLHLVINNQVGFTTNYLDARTSTYCTDVAKTIQAPVFHVNGDDAEAVAFTTMLAIEYRQRFHKDIFIDLLCYRKYGHNEGDEPRFTQPVLYRAIENHDDPRLIYEKKLLVQKDIKAEEAIKIETDFYNLLEESLVSAKKITSANITSFLEKEWKGIKKASNSDFDKSPKTGVKLTVLQDIAKKITSLPPDKKFFRKIVRLQKTRFDMVFKHQKLDWAMGELFAYGSLLNEGIPVRISGQDVQRGTFSHRHAVFTIDNSEETYTPLKNISKNQAPFHIYNSLLSEYGVLGFEYGYAMASPNELTIWEAQFGDFNNAAQIIFDQFLSSAEDKWNVMNDLVILLPHGFEGQGPEHSSGRMERFLTLCADNNFQVANVTTPANMFHILRRQLKREFRKPLVIFTPKSLLRLQEAVSDLDDFAKGGFQELIDDKNVDADKIKNIAFCSGKVYYDLLAEKKVLKNDNLAIVRLEQIYPLPKKQIDQILAKYKNAKNLMWVQEEPYNMGANPFIRSELEHLNLFVIARPATGSPATGSSKFHQKQQRKIIEKTFEECNDCSRIGTICKMACIGNNWKQFIESEQNISK